MARLNNNAWIHGHSDDNFARANGAATVINLIIDEQSAHGIFSIVNSNALKWQGDAYPGTGIFVCYIWGNTRDGDDNEEGYGAFLFDYGIVGTTQQDYAVEPIGMMWSNLNTTHPDKEPLVTGTTPPMVSDAANQLMSLYWESNDFWNADVTANPSMRFTVAQLGP